MLTLSDYHEEAPRKAEEDHRRDMRPFPVGMSIPQFGGTAEGSIISEGGDPDYLGMARKGLSVYDKAAGTNYGGYAGAALAFKKFMDWSFDKDAPGGGIGRRNIHILEDIGRFGKDTIKEVPGVKPVLKGAGDALSSVGNFFSDLF